CQRRCEAVASAKSATVGFGKFADRMRSSGSEYATKSSSRLCMEMVESVAPVNGRKEISSGRSLGRTIHSRFRKATIEPGCIKMKAQKLSENQLCGERKSRSALYLSRSRRPQNRTPWRLNPP